MSDQVLLRISFGIASLIFELVLFVLLMLQGHGRRDNNLKFRTLVILVLFGNTASILDNIFRVSEQFHSSEPFQVFLQLSVLVLNVFLTYYVFLYLGTFVKNIERRSSLHAVSTSPIINPRFPQCFLLPRQNRFSAHGLA